MSDIYRGPILIAVLSAVSWFIGAAIGRRVSKRTGTAIILGVLIAWGLYTVYLRDSILLATIGSIDELRRMTPGALIVAAGFESGANVDAIYHEQGGWKPGVLHTVLLFDFVANGRVKMADPLIYFAQEYISLGLAVVIFAGAIPVSRSPIPAAGHSGRGTLMRPRTAVGLAIRFPSLLCQLLNAPEKVPPQEL